MSTRTSTRIRLLDATDQVVFADGDTHAPVDRILERAGVSPATLYRAYGSKDALVAAALDRRHQEWLAVWDDCVDRATDDRGRLMAIVDAIEEFRRRTTGARWCAFLGTAAGYADPPPVLAAAIRQDSESMRARLRTLAEPLAGDQSALLVDGVMLIVSGELAMRLRPEPSRAGTARALVDLLIDGCLPGRREVDLDG